MLAFSSPPMHAAICRPQAVRLGWPKFLSLPPSPSLCPCSCLDAAYQHSQQHPHPILTLTTSLILTGLWSAAEVLTGFGARDAYLGWIVAGLHFFAGVLAAVALAVGNRDKVVGGEIRLKFLFLNKKNYPQLPRGTLIPSFIYQPIPPQFCVETLVLYTRIGRIS